METLSVITEPHPYPLILILGVLNMVNAGVALLVRGVALRLASAGRLVGSRGPTCEALRSVGTYRSTYRAS